MKALCGIAFPLLLLLLMNGTSIATGPGAEVPDKGRKAFSFVPQWLPQAQFAGFYVAHEMGFYKREGLEITILRGGPSRPSAESLRKGEVDFCTMFLSTGIQERSRGTKLVNIGQMFFKSSQTLIAKKSGGIGNWHEINGKKVGLWSAELSILPMALFKRYGIQPVIIPQSSTINLFLRGGVDLVSAMRYNEYHTILSSGVDPEELTVFNLADFGMNFPEDGIYCLETTFRKSPESCCRFTKATLEGWKYAFDNKEQALDIVMKYVEEAKTSTNRPHQKWMIERVREVMGFPEGGDSSGFFGEKDFMAVASELKAQGMIENIPSFSEFFVDCSVANEK